MAMPITRVPCQLQVERGNTGCPSALGWSCLLSPPHRGELEQGEYWATTALWLSPQVSVMLQGFSFLTDCLLYVFIWVSSPPFHNQKTLRWCAVDLYFLNLQHFSLELPQAMNRNAITLMVTHGNICVILLSERCSAGTMPAGGAVSYTCLQTFTGNVFIWWVYCDQTVSFWF